MNLWYKDAIIYEVNVKSFFDKNITSIIKKKAKASGYNLVLVKSSVIDGGTDITADIIKDLK